MEVLKSVFSGGEKKSKNKKRKSGSALTNRSSISGVDVPRVRSSSSSSCIQESEREGFVFVERLKEGNSTSDVTSSNAPNADSSPATTSAASPTKQSATSASTSSNVDADAALAARLGDLDVRRGQVETESIQKTSPSHSIGAAAATSGVTNSGGGEADNFLTLKYVKGGFCLDKKLEKKSEK